MATGGLKFYLGREVKGFVGGGWSDGGGDPRPCGGRVAAGEGCGARSIMIAGHGREV